MKSINDYFEFICLNSPLPRNDAYITAIDCWNRGLDKYEVLKEIKLLKNFLPKDIDK